MKSQQATRHFIISGNVQGVGFRAATKAKAQQLGLSGWVRNLDTGEVEAKASGEAGLLDEFETWLESGPDAADVNTVRAEAVTESLDSGFTVRY